MLELVVYKDDAAIQVAETVFIGGKQGDVELVELFKTGTVDRRKRIKNVSSSRLIEDFHIHHNVRSHAYSNYVHHSATDKIDSQLVLFVALESCFLT